jgi:hypothetical protein
LSVLEPVDRLRLAKYIKVPTLVALHQESYIVACLLPLWEGTQPFMKLVERSHQIRPVDPITLEPISKQTTFEQVKEL